MKIKTILLITGITFQSLIYSQDIVSDHIFGLSKSIIVEDCNSNDDCIVLPSKNSKIVTTVDQTSNRRTSYFFDSNFEMYKQRMKIDDLNYTKEILRKRYSSFNPYETKYWSNTQKVEIISKNGKKYLDVESKNFTPEF